MREGSRGGGGERGRGRAEEGRPRTPGLRPPHFAAMEELIVELRLFLELLDHEYLTSTVREKKAVVTEILLRVQKARGQPAPAPSLPPNPPASPTPGLPVPAPSPHSCALWICFPGGHSW